MINNIKILDCTLRDGGYVNDWQFGDQDAQDIVRLLSQVGLEYVELGFIKLCDYVPDKLQFNDMSQVSQLFKPCQQKLAVMVELGYGYPATAFPEHSENTADLVRVVIWKRMLKESLEYCRILKDKGYEVGMQITRTDQYSEEEFGEVADMMSEAMPNVVYIVDTFGLLTKESLLGYATQADKYLDSSIRLGYHAHNNLQQAYSNALAFIEHPWKHTIMVDASVMGMGRGAGNLCIELLAKYMNEHGSSLQIPPLLQVMEKYLMPFYQKNPWGYSIPYFLSASNGINPAYVNYMLEKGISITQMRNVFDLMKERDAGIRFDTIMCDGLILETNE